ncbi:MAG: cation diffusion facilitator family transporter [Bacteroidales bacterium]|jgi:cation diffusion facilitator family transporter|nr:cation diffusion facilitator family transporter [Bacteroidales bacterium]MDD2824854.1 cation diffusion facilitator family transporter [Bacteroidales bacterium]MDD3639720.1 cation diffusion facilitator family transporter [Bacteroidales bacterium]MDD3944346.1 cation diffusion facilitator family transporter [Bacteroidales bacterium]MDD4479890.1 cation diffusion facilitator family transporter [Bacteroidales bacterium]
MKSSTGKEKREKTIARVTWVGFFTNLLLSAGKMAAGILGRSGAMIADAIHSISDFLTDVIVLIFVKVSVRPANEKYRYGHGKFETLATFLVGIILVFVALELMWGNVKTILAILTRELIPERPGQIALWAAALSIVTKEILYWYTYLQGRRVNSPAVIANAWHHRSDALSSVATLTGIGLAYFLGEKWRILDPVAAIFVGILILRVAFKLLKPALEELMERSLPREEEKRILEIIANEFPVVRDPHKLKTRHIGNARAIQLDIRLDGFLTVNESHDIAEAIEQRLLREFGPETYVIVHVDPFREGSTS